jgi:hypothetical protein
MPASRMPGKTQTRKYSEKKHNSAEAEEDGTTGGKRTVVWSKKYRESQAVKGRIWRLGGV